MRLREPLNGFKLAQGHPIIHVALLFGSIIVLNVKTDYYLVNGEIGKQTFNDLTQLVSLVRYTHTAILVSQFIQYLMERNNMENWSQMFGVLQVFLYTGMVQFEQHSLNNIELGNLQEHIDQCCAFWIMIEITSYYFLILSAIIYLLTVQCTGICGPTSKVSRKYLSERYKYDALDYYIDDINWFSFSIMLIGIHLNGIGLVNLIHSGKVKWIDENNVQVSDQSHGRGEIYVIYAILLSRFIQLFLLSTFRSVHRQFIPQKHVQWLFVLLLYVCIFVVYRIFRAKVTHIVLSCIIVDSFMSVLSYLYFIFKCQMAIIDERLKEEKKMDLSRHRNQISEGEQLKFGSFQTNAQSNQDVDDNWELEDETAFDPAYKNREVMVQSDTYSLAFTSLLEPRLLQKYHDGKDGYLQPVRMSKTEYTNIFFGAFMVASLQITILLLIVKQMMQDDFNILATTSFEVLIPRTISTILMHMIVEPEIRNGIKLMKYSVNHPHMFRGSMNPKNGSINANKVLPAFLLGFTQTLIAICVEYIIVIYLSSKDNLITIFMQFAALTQLIKIDNFYGDALSGNKMKRQVGKKLLTQFRRNMINSEEEQRMVAEKQNPSFFGQKSGTDPKANSIMLKFLRFVNKGMRIFFVSYNYYFMPFFTMYLGFWVNFKKQHSLDHV